MATWTALTGADGSSPDYRILREVELGQPHIDAARARQLLDLSALERVDGSLHTLPMSDQPGALRCEPITLYRRWQADRVIGEYLAEVRRAVRTRTQSSPTSSRPRQRFGRQGWCQGSGR